MQTKDPSANTARWSRRSELRGDDGRISAFVRSITEPGALADTAGYSPDLNYAQKVELSRPSTSSSG